MHFDEPVCVDRDDVAAELGAEERPHDGDQTAARQRTHIEELDDIVIGARNIGTRGMAVGAVVELLFGAVRVGAIQADLIPVGGLPSAEDDLTVV